MPEPWIYIDSGLQDGTSYTYTVITRDIRGNESLVSSPESAIPGLDINPPSPNPSEWAVEPFQSGLNAASMEAVQAVDAEGNGVEYFFDCDDDAFDSGWQPNADYEAVGLVLDVANPVIYTFSVVTRDGSSNQNQGTPSDTIPVAILEIDDQPPYDPGLDPEDPLYNTAKHASGSPFQFQAQGGRWWHVVTSIEMEDDSGVEYKFVNTDNSYYNSGNDGDPDGIEWRNVDNVAGLPLNPNGTLQVPWQYWADRGISTAVFEEWRIEVRDRVQPVPNESVPSETRSINDPQP